LAIDLYGRGQSELDKDEKHTADLFVEQIKDLVTHPDIAFVPPEKKKRARGPAKRGARRNKNKINHDKNKKKAKTGGDDKEEGDGGTKKKPKNEEKEGDEKKGKKEEAEEESDNEKKTTTTKKKKKGKEEKPDDTGEEKEKEEKKEKKEKKLKKKGSPETDPNDWTEDEVGAWLATVSAETAVYAAMFKENNINGKRLLRLTDEKLKSMGVTSLGIRDDILTELEELKK